MTGQRQPGQLSRHICQPRVQCLGHGPDPILCTFFLWLRRGKHGERHRDSRSPCRDGIICRTEEEDVSRKRGGRGDEVWRDLGPRQSVALVVSRGARIPQVATGHSETGLNDSRRQVDHLHLEGAPSKGLMATREQGARGERSWFYTLLEARSLAKVSRGQGLWGLLLKPAHDLAQKRNPALPVAWTLAPKWPCLLGPRIPSTHNGAFYYTPSTRACLATVKLS